jgi:tRNA-2-methylthio-N6-dimethylallyladenosine synthase
MNTHESEKIAGVLETLGYCSVAEKAQADLIIFNTCCVRQHAEARLYGNIGALKGHKENVKGALIAVSGCVMQQEGAAKKLMKRFPFVDFAFGTNGIHRLESLLYDALIERKRAFIVDEDESIIEDVPIRRDDAPNAFVNIIYGCNNYCTYCIVPYVRGRERSRRPDDIVKEINELCIKGVSEITLLGQNVNSYGNDLSADITFVNLLKRIDSETDIRRLRFMTSHPKDMSDALIECYGSLKSLCEHIHLPVQSGSNRVLQLMNRRYTREHYLSLIERLKAQVPDLAVTTDIIVGFPGETEQDFEDTLSLVKEVGYDAAYTFAYSKRTGTKAADMENHLDKQTVSERLARLNALVKESMRERNSAYLGRTVEVLAESPGKRGRNEISGRTRTSKTVSFEGTQEDVGNYVTIKIDKVMAHTLHGIRV